MERRPVLGKGLDALIPQDVQGNRERVLTLRIDQIRPSPFQPRVHFKAERIEQLASSIREKGIIQPVLVRAHSDGTYELIAGERRFRAAKLLGLQEIPAIARKISDEDLLETSLIENIQREELNPLEEAKAYRRLATEFGLSQDSIAKRVGKDKSTVSNLLRLLTLPDAIQDFLSADEISLGHAKALLSLLEEKSQLAFCEKIVKQGLSVRQLEALTQGVKGATRRARTPRQKDPNLRELETRLERHLGTKVRVVAGKKRGRIEIEYYSLDDLDRLLVRLGAH